MRVKKIIIGMAVCLSVSVSVDIGLFACYPAGIKQTGIRVKNGKTELKMVGNRITIYHGSVNICTESSSTNEMKGKGLPSRLLDRKNLVVGPIQVVVHNHIQFFIKSDSFPERFDNGCPKHNAQCSSPSLPTQDDFDGRSGVIKSSVEVE